MSLPTFDRFFEALHGDQSPVPWQRRLAGEVLERGWPDLLELPTGVGKTSMLEIALYCLARAPERMPRRTLLVVDRRTVVDQGAMRARKILVALQRAEDGPLREIADALRTIGGAAGEDAPFAVAVMRGGMPRDNDCARRPAQPVLGVSTVDQVGSRLLFRGYGVSPRSASIHAGLLGNDTLLLLDEVHLAVPFTQTLDAIRRRYRAAASGLPDRFGIVRISAMPGATPPGCRVFTLDDDDRGHHALRPRLSASKTAVLAPVKVTGTDERAKQQVIARRVVAEALALQAEGARVVGAIVNRVDTARIVRRLLRGHERTTEAMLVTGRMRPLDRDRIVRARLLPRAGADRTRTPEEHPLVVVATQCVEAGADLDFDGMVTECASLDALHQRFGRVDRRGELQQTRSVILGRSDQVAPGQDDPVYGVGLAATWEWLGEHARNGSVDLGIGALPAPVDAQGRRRVELLAPALDAPILLPTHLDAWSQTSQHPWPDPDVALWLHGPKESPADVQIVWRAGVDLQKERVTELVERFAACRPSSLEAVTLPLAAVRHWLAGEPAAQIADVIGGVPEQDEEWRERRTRGAPLVALRWCGVHRDTKAVTVDEIRAGDVLVVDAARGGLDDDSFDPDARRPVFDLGDLAQLRGRGIASLRLDARALAAWDLPEAMLASIPAPSPDEITRELADRVIEWLRRIPPDARGGFLGESHEWTAAREAWSKQPRVAVIGGTIIVTARVSKERLREEPEVSESLTEDDDSSFRQVEVTLRAHNTDVRDFAARFGRAIGFAEDVVEDLALAGWLHDVGKADPRFQRWLVGGDEARATLLPEPLAKSALPAGNAQHQRLARARAGYPDGYRHELLSLEMIRSSEEALRRAHDRELVMHLVASHHGWCRPFAPLLDDPEELCVRLDHGDDPLAGTTRHRLARLDSGVSDRFWALTEKYGWWGLAWLEAVIRLADHRASEQETEART